MKLRLRSLETKETLKIEVTNPCNLEYLRELVSQKSPSPQHSSTIYFSLNRKNELTTNSPEESIQSIGITSGDLIYFTTNPNGFSTTPQVIPSTPKSQQSLNLDSKNQDETLKTLKPEKGKTVNFSTPDPEDTTESMEIDNENNSVTKIGKSFSVPGFLRKVFTEELGDKDVLNKLLAISVRAVFLESGFVEVINPASNPLNNWHLASFYYTLPNITSTIKIKFQNLGKYCKVYGSLVNGTVVHSVLLDEDKLIPFLNVVWANCGQIVETIEENNTISSVSPEKEVFEFWRKVKDNLVLPLLIDLCEKTGLELPPCFMRLPTELKLKIMDSVSGVDIAKVSCVCSELRYLCSSEDLWKQKYVEEFGSVVGSGFKEMFGRAWEGRKRRRVGGRSGFNLMRRSPYAPFGARFPRIIGGDYDVMPGFGQIGRPGGGGPRLRNVMPDCNLGGFGS